MLHGIDRGLDSGDSQVKKNVMKHKALENSNKINKGGLGALGNTSQKNITNSLLLATMDESRKEISEAELKAHALKIELESFSGTETYFKLTDSSPMMYTDGVRFLATETKAYWLLSLIESFYAHKARFIQKNDFLTIKLTTLINEPYPTGLLRFEDGNYNIIHAYAIDSTTFPIDELKLFLIDNVLLLPSEY